MKYLLLSLFLFCSCRTVDIHVEYNEGVDFSRFKSFNWLNPKKNKNKDYTSLKEQKVGSLIKELMKERGLEFADKADVLIAVNIVEKEKFYTVQNSHSYSSAWGYHGHWAYEPHYYTESTLVVAIVDPQSKNSLWEGSIKDWHFERLTSIEVKALIIELFKNYPALIPES